jgi:hypothetical protein
MKKFSEVNEGKIFIADPSVIKKYAAYIIPLFLNGLVNCDERLLDEWLEMNKRANKHKLHNYVADIEVFAVKQVLENPMTQSGFEKLQQEVDMKCPKLERYLRQFYIKPENFK